MTDFSSKQYKKVLAANKRRNAIPTMAWTPLTEDSDKIDFTQDSEYIRMFGVDKNDCVHTKLYKAQAELIDLWVEEEEKRLPPKPPMSPFS
tara:strand:+ start:644 stop:916 length:273 start_codon:yes stop_codon:yes gene_type:complete